MKNRITVLALTISFACSAQATSNNVQQQLDDLKAGLHQVHINTLGKYSESWGLEDRANIAKMQETKLDKSVYTADQARQDKALSDSVSKQAATDAKQTSDLKGYADKKAESAYSTSIAHTDAKVARADSDRAKGDAVLQQQITSNLSVQSQRDTGQDEHINTVQGAAQTANDRASNLEVRADGAESAIRETNTQLQVTDARSQNNSVRLDGVETVNANQDKLITQNTSDIVQLYSNGQYAQQRIDSANANIQANRNAITSANRVVSQHSAQLANHEQRLTTLEQETNRNFDALRNQVDRNKKDADAGIAGVAAMASIPQVTEYQTFSVGAGVGNRHDQQALAVGFSARADQNVVVKVSAATDSSSSWTVGAGAAIGW